MIEFKQIRNKNLSESEIDSIIRIKQQHWPYDAKLQRQWMRSNLRPEDVHFFLRDEHDIITYLNIACLDVMIDDQWEKAEGIGNVCTDRKHLKNGWASALLKLFSCRVRETGRFGVLLCHQPLMPFYSSNGWNPIPDRAVKMVDGLPYKNEVMLLHHSIDASQIVIPRDF